MLWLCVQCYIVTSNHYFVTDIVGHRNMKVIPAIRPGKSQIKITIMLWHCVCAVFTGNNQSLLCYWYYWMLSHQEILAQLKRERSHLQQVSNYKEPHRMLYRHLLISCSLNSHVAMDTWHLIAEVTHHTELLYFSSGHELLRSLFFVFLVIYRERHKKLSFMMPDWPNGHKLQASSHQEYRPLKSFPPDTKQCDLQ